MQVVRWDPPIGPTSRCRSSFVTVVVSLCHGVTTFVGRACGPLVPTTCVVPGDNGGPLWTAEPADGRGGACNGRAELVPDGPFGPRKGSVRTARPLNGGCGRRRQGPDGLARRIRL